VPVPGAGVEGSQVGLLVANLASPDPRVRLAAAEALARLGRGAASAAPDLEAAIRQESDPRVREALQQALRQIRARPEGAAGTRRRMGGARATPIRPIRPATSGGRTLREPPAGASP